ncbi:hypothetical protein [Flavobacterium sp. SM2513]|uniref:hypothetical protein n=1 Tax=Flavobacterium sp. SM2513 TaxID=3424766 RepID=UPI003D7F1FB3
MNWEYLKDKILVFGDDDWIFSDMFISIVGDYEGCFNDEDRMLYTYKMLREIMSDNLIDIYFIKPNENLTPFIYNNAQDIDYFISKIDVEWKKQNYKVPDPDQLFWATTNSNGKSQIQ